MIWFFIILSNSLSEAAIFSTSARWFNYRHSANAFNMAYLLRSNQINPSKLFLGIGENPVYNIRNPFPGKIYIDDKKKLNVYVTPNLTDDSLDKYSFRNVLLRGPISHDTSPLTPIRGGKFLLYLTGHGGDGFFKFREVDQIKSDEFGEIIDEMKRILKFDELLIILDTCEAFSFFSHIHTSNVTVIASSSYHQKSMSSHYDTDYHIPLSDLFTYNLCDLLRTLPRTTTLLELIQRINKKYIGSTPMYKQFNCTKHISKMMIKDWFFPDQ